MPVTVMFLPMEHCDMGVATTSLNLRLRPVLLAVASLGARFTTWDPTLALYWAVRLREQREPLLWARFT